MFEGIVSRYLSKYLGDYFDGLDEKNLSIGVYSGHVHLQNVDFKKEAVDMLHLPVKLIHGKLGSLHVYVPWNRLGSSPIVIELDNLYLVVEPKKREEWSQEYEVSRLKASRKKLATAVDMQCEVMAQQEVFEEEEEQQNNNKRKDDKKDKPEREGYIASICRKMADNVELRVSNIHIRYAYSNAEHTTGGACGITLQGFTMTTTDSSWTPVFVDRKASSSNGHQVVGDSRKDDTRMYKLVRLERLGAYWNPFMLLKTKDTPQGETPARSRGTSSRVSFDTSSFTSFDDDEEYEDGESGEDKNYIIEPVSGSLRMIRTPVAKKLPPDDPNFVPKIQLTGALDAVSMRMTKSQYAGILRTASLFSDYNAYRSAIERRVRYVWPWRPLREEGHPERTARMMWRYAVGCVVRDIRQTRRELGQESGMPKLLGEVFTDENLMRLVQQRKYKATLHRIERKNKKRSIGGTAERSNSSSSEEDSIEEDDDDSEEEKSVEEYNENEVFGCLLPAPSEPHVGAISPIGPLSTCINPVEDREDDLEVAMKSEDLVVGARLAREARQTKAAQGQGWVAWFWGVKPQEVDDASKKSIGDDDGKRTQESYSALVSSLLVPESESITISLYMRLASVRLEPSRSVYSLGSLHDVSITCTVSGTDYRLKASLGNADVIAKKNGRLYDILKRESSGEDTDGVDEEGDLLSLVLNPKEAVLTAAKLAILYDRTLLAELLVMGSTTDKATVPAVAANKASWWEGVRQWDKLIAMQQQLVGGTAAGLRSLVKPDDRKLKVKVRIAAPTVLLPVHTYNSGIYISLNLGTFALCSLTRKDMQEVNLKGEVAEVCGREKGLTNPTVDVWRIGMTGVRAELLRSGGRQGSILDNMDLAMRVFIISKPLSIDDNAESGMLVPAPTRVRLRGDINQPLKISLDVNKYHALVRAMRLLLSSPSAAAGGQPGAGQSPGGKKIPNLGRVTGHQPGQSTGLNFVLPAEEGIQDSSHKKDKSSSIGEEEQLNWASFVSVELSISNTMVSISCIEGSTIDLTASAISAMVKVHHMYTKLSFGLKALSIMNGPDEMLMSDTAEELVDITVFISDRKIAMDEKGQKSKMLFNFKLGAVKAFFRPKLWRALVGFIRNMPVNDLPTAAAAGDLLDDTKSSASDYSTLVPTGKATAPPSLVYTPDGDTYADWRLVFVWSAMSVEWFEENSEKDGPFACSEMTHSSVNLSMRSYGMRLHVKIGNLTFTYLPPSGRGASLPLLSLRPGDEYIFVLELKTYSPDDPSQEFPGHNMGVKVDLSGVRVWILRRAVQRVWQYIWAQFIPSVSGDTSRDDIPLVADIPTETDRPLERMFTANSSEIGDGESVDSSGYYSLDDDEDYGGVMSQDEEIPLTPLPPPPPRSAASVAVGGDAIEDDTSTLQKSDGANQEANDSSMVVTANLIDSSIILPATEEPDSRLLVTRGTVVCQVERTSSPSRGPTAGSMNTKVTLHNGTLFTTNDFDTLNRLEKEWKRREVAATSPISESSAITVGSDGVGGQARAIVNDCDAFVSVLIETDYESDKLITENKSIHLNFEPLHINVSYSDIMQIMASYELLMKYASGGEEEEEALTDGSGGKDEDQSGDMVSDVSPSSSTATPKPVDEVCTVHRADFDLVFHRINLTLVNDSGRTTNTPFVNILIANCQMTHNGGSTGSPFSLDEIDSVVLDNDSPRSGSVSSRRRGRRVGPGHGVLVTQRATNAINAEIASQFFNPVAVAWEPLLESESADPGKNGTIDESLSMYKVLVKQKRIGVVQGGRASEKNDLSVEATHQLLMVNISQAFLRALKQNMNEFTRVWNDKKPLSGRGEAADKLQYAPYSIRNLSGSPLLVTWEAHDHGGRSRESSVPVKIGVGEERRLTEISIHVATNNARMAKDRAFVSIQGDGWEQDKIPLDRKGKYLYYVDDGTVNDVVGFEPYAIIEPVGGRASSRSYSYGTTRSVLRPQGSVPISGGVRSGGTAIICEVTATEDGRKMLVVMSAVLVKNSYGTPVQLRVTRPGEEMESVATVPVEGVAAVPLALCAQRMLTDKPGEWPQQRGDHQAPPKLSFRPLDDTTEEESEALDNPFSNEVSLIELFNRCLASSPALGPTNSRLYPLRCSLGRLHKEVFMYISCGVRHYHYRDQGAKQIIITLNCPVKIRSTLPIPVDYHLTCTSEVVPVRPGHPLPIAPPSYSSTGTLTLNCQEHLHSVHLGARLELRLCAFGNVWSDPQVIWPADLAVVKAGKNARKMAENVEASTEDKPPSEPMNECYYASITLTLHDEHRNPLRLLLLIVSRPTQPLDLILHTPYWLMSTVPQPYLRYAYEEKTDDGEQPDEAFQAPRWIAHWGARPSSSDPEAVKAGVVLPLDCYGTKLAAYLNNTCSRPFSIDTVGFTSAIAVENGSYGVGHQPTASSRLPISDYGGEIVQSGDERNEARKRQELGVRVVTSGDVRDLSVRCVHVTPRYVVVNSMKDRWIMIKQADSPSSSALELEPEQQMSFKWWQVDLPKMLQVRLKDTGWGWSGQLAVDRVVGDSVCQVFQETEGMFMNIRVDVRPYRSCVFVVFCAEEYNIASYSVRNNSDVSMWIRQAHTRAYFIPLLRHSTTPFAWYEPTKPKKLEILLDPASKRSTIVDFIPDQTTSQAQSATRASAQSGGGLTVPAFEHSGTMMAPLRGRQQKLRYKVTSSGPTKVFIFYNDSVGTGAARLALPSGPIRPSSRTAAQGPLSDDSRRDRAVDSVYRAEFKGVGVSLVAAVRGRPRSELLFAGIIGIEGVASIRHNHRDFHLAVQDIRVDNQNLNAAYPVMFARSTCGNPRAALTDGTTQGSATGLPKPIHPMLELAATLRDIDADLTYFENFSVLVQESELAFDFGFIFDMVSLVEGIQFVGGKSKHWAVEVKPEIELLPEDSSNDLHFDVFTLHPTRLFVSFSPGNTEQKFLKDYSLVYRVLASMSAVDHSPVQLNALILYSLSVSRSSLNTIVAEHYKHQLFRELRTIMGSADAIGNPIGLFNHVSQGISDLFYEPYSAIMNVQSAGDVLSVAGGTAKGARSFVRNTAFGVFNSLGKIAGTAAQTMSVLTQDDEFQQDRQRFAQRNRPVHVGDGVAVGAASLGRGILSGISGLVLKPVEAVEQEGINGLGKGILRGVGGLVTKPMVGFLDFTRSTAEGVTATTGAATAKSTATTAKRMRLPRMLYGDDMVVRSYNPEHAVLRSFLSTVDGVPTDFPYVAHQFDEQGRRLIITGNNYVLVIDVPTHRLESARPLWQVQVPAIAATTPSASSSSSSSPSAARPGRALTMGPQSSV
ncbi:hypothetical protein FOL47_003213 [Perkinsus chesapeaki]|uniref:Vacuolar protein n=1 Tax=Perkinsus chesapeaki TaxID=330153 RepID=A0A7J6M9A1_PERCH|nr:hypothetical protein FOL47_003213 [Perkinsus chesapeaki]